MLRLVEDDTVALPVLRGIDTAAWESALLD
jgi:hypothetical protein